MRDLAYYVAVRKGVEQNRFKFGDMPALTNIDAKQVAHIVAYIRKTQRHH